MAELVERVAPGPALAVPGGASSRRPVCLATRKAGEAVGRVLSETLQAAVTDGRANSLLATSLPTTYPPRVDGLFLDFAGVEFLDYSAADETVGRLLYGLLGGEFEDAYLAAGNLADGPREVVRRTLELRSLAVLHLPASLPADHRSGPRGPAHPPSASGLRSAGRRWEVLGAVPEASLPILEAVLDRGAVTVDDVAEALGRPVATVGARLRRLYRMRLVGRPDRPTRGKRPAYGCIGGRTGEHITEPPQVRQAG